MTPVTDPKLVAALDGGNGPGQAVSDPTVLARLEHDLDVSAPVEAVRAKIAGIADPKRREEALRVWADAYVANESKQGGIGRSVDNAVRTMSRGTFVGSFLDEANAATAAGVHALTGGRAGAPYDESVAYQRARDRAVDRDNPVLSTVGQIAGGIAGGGAALKVGGGVTGTVLGGPLATAAPAPSIGGRMAQGVPIGATHGYAHGFGNAEGGIAERHDGGLRGAGVGAVVGAALPPVLAGLGRGATAVADAASPITARLGAQANAALDRLAIRASHTAAPPSNPGAEAAAEQVIANQLARANVSPQMLRQRLAEADEAARMHANSRAQNVTAPVDLDPSLQRLASSVARQQPEAGNIGTAFQVARQTGQPSGLPMPQGAGLPTRPAFAPTRAGDPPMGQYERVKDALKRAMLIRDEDFHGHARSAYRTEQQIIARAKDEARDLYDTAYRAGQGVDLRPALTPVAQATRARMIDEPVEVARHMERFVQRVERALSDQGSKSHIERFDKVKQWFDGVIEKFFESSEGRNRYIGGVLSDMKNAYLAAVDNVPGLGAAYNQARGTFSSAMEARDALRAGRDVFRANSEVAVDQYRELTSPGLQKLFRLGLLDGFDQHIGRQGRAQDVTQVFQSPRIQEILREVIPRAGRGAQFADRPERFGRWLEGERRMIATRNETMGNSKTAQRLADDQATNALQSMAEQARQIAGGQSLTVTALRTLEATLNRMFGMRADTAAEIARRLYAAAPAERDRFLQAIERRMGPTRAAQLARLLDEQQRAITNAAARTAGGNVGGRD